MSTFWRVVLDPRPVLLTLLSLCIAHELAKHPVVFPQRPVVTEKD
jgi:hypothetical protein